MKSKPMCPSMAWTEIDAKALVSNAKAVKRLAGKDTGILAVVKANAYGHGLEKVAKVLNKQDVKFFGVSDINEGIVLRNLGIKKRIMILENVLSKNAKHLIKYNIAPVLCTIELAKALNNLAVKKRIKVPVHIKVDTGMGRLGVCQIKAFDFIREVERLPGIVIEGLCTHFPLADIDNSFTKRQIKTILCLADKAKKEIKTIKYVHAANSAGLAVFSHQGFNLARTGLMLYGLYPSRKMRNRINLTPVMSVKSRVCFIKNIFKGRGISYGHTFIAKKKMRVATVSIGYNDGYLRSLSNKAKVIIRGQRCPVVGNVTMDQIMVDVSRVKDVSIGDEVCVMGKQGKHQVTADDLAKIVKTINYEIICRLGIAGKQY
ncbi:MAG: alanine racemase [Candidatus Aceula lacicola]|nr:alanine racemase [Candidatus Aceula lacicola]